jgi:hypothetical protein
MESTGPPQSRSRKELAKVDAPAPLSKVPEGRHRMRLGSTLPDVKERLTGAYSWNHAILIISLSYPYFRAEHYLSPPYRLYFALIPYPHSLVFT